MADPPPGALRYEARLASRVGGHTLTSIWLEVPGDVLSTHTMPGQYVSIIAEGENGYFVLASPVGASAWRLLAKGGGTVADAILAAPIGTDFATTAALGHGFPCDEARGRPLVVAAAGTGIAAAPPIAARRIADGDAARTRIFLGLPSAADLPCPEDVDTWRAAGIAVVLCISREEARVPGAERGYVQDIARARLTREEGMMIFTVGPAQMVAGVRALAPTLGMRDEDVRTNY